MEANNIKAMRDACVRCRELAEVIWQSEGGWDVSPEIAELRDSLNFAISLPARNCDVGTLKEQEERMLGYCRTHKDSNGIIICAKCPHRVAGKKCALQWAQMPYAEEGGAE